jgi:lipopolysaccharide export system protein LptA
MSFPAKDTQETVIRSDAMEMTSQEGDHTIFQFTGHVQVESDDFRASAQALTAHLSGNPIEENARERESGVEVSPHLTQLQAEGDVHIHVYQKEEEDRTGSADQVEVDTINDVFTLVGNAQIYQKGKGNITGARITLDRRQNRLKVEGEAANDDVAKVPQRPTIKLEPAALPSELRSEVHREVLPADEDGRDSSPLSPVESSSPNHLKVEGEAASDGVTKIPQRPTIRLEPAALPPELRSEIHREVPPVGEDKRDSSPLSPVESSSPTPLIEAKEARARPVS